ncbi:unnamed protein product [Alopecurus aequalis]
MAPPKKPKAQSDFKGVRLLRSGRYAAELRYWLGKFVSPDLAARAYNIAGRRLGVPSTKLNFPDITCLQDAVFVGPPMKKKIKTRVVTCKERLNIEENDDEAMTRFARENPQYVQYEQEFFLKHKMDMKKKSVEARRIG